MYISMKVGSSGEGFDFLHKGANQKGKKEVTSKAVGWWNNGDLQLVH